MPAFKISSAFLGVLLLLVLPMESTAQLTHETSENLYDKGLACYRKGWYVEAIRHLSRSIFENAKNIDAYVLRAACKEFLNDYSGAVADLNTGLELQPDNYELLFKRATIRYQLNQWEFARQDFVRLLSLPMIETSTVFYRQSAHRPGTDQIVTAQSNVRSQLYNYLGLIDMQLKFCTTAIAWLDSAITGNPNDADYYLNRFLAKQQCNVNSSLDDLQKALQLNPNHAIAKHHIALLEVNVDDATREKRFSDAIQADSLLVDPYLHRGMYRFGKKDLTGALADYNIALKLKSDDPEIWLNRGLVKEKLHDLSGAYADYTMAIELQEDFVQAWLNRGNLQALKNDYSNAIEDYTVAIIYKPDYAAAFYNRALAFSNLGNQLNACTDLLQAKELGFDVNESLERKLCLKK